MRSFSWGIDESRCRVTHPHEGLWVIAVSCFQYGMLLLRIPMRGYESDADLIWRDSCNVTHPHEGLWAASYGTGDVAFSSYASPWGVMRCSFAQFAIPSLVLRISMRGYERLSAPNRLVNEGYASPWGVMSFSIAILAIGDSFGYASPWGVMRKVFGWWATKTGESYASPWGVMRRILPRTQQRNYELRIPMRGYELKKVGL